MMLEFLWAIFAMTEVVTRWFHHFYYEYVPQAFNSQEVFQLCKIGHLFYFIFSSIKSMCYFNILITYLI